MPIVSRPPSRFRRLRSACVLLPFALLAATPSAESIRIKLATQAPEQSPWGKEIRAIGAAIEARTAGRVQLQVYAGGVQGDERTVLRKLRIGQLHASSFVGQGIEDVAPSCSAIKLPLLCESVAEMNAVIAAVSERLEQEARDKGHELLAIPHLGFTYLFSKEPVLDVAGLRRTRPWLIENDRMSVELYDALQVTPESSSTADVTAGLQSGLIGAVFSPAVALIAMQWHPYLKHRLDVKINYSIGIVTITREAWQKLSSEDQRIVREEFRRGIGALNEKMAKQEGEALEVLERGGMKTNPVDPQSLIELARATEKVVDKLTHKLFSAELLAAIRAARDDYRKSGKSGK